jgi:hypothetical protein
MMVEWRRRCHGSKILSIDVSLKNPRGTSRISLVVTLHAENRDSQGSRYRDPWVSGWSSEPCDAFTRTTHTASRKGVVALSTVCYKLEAWLADCISRVGSPGRRFCLIRVALRARLFEIEPCSVGTTAPEIRESTLCCTSYIDR